jgi:hypothetical protein
MFGRSRIFCEVLSKLGGYGQSLSLLIVNGHSGEAIAVPKVLDYLLQTLLLRTPMGIIVQRPNNLLKAIRQDFGTPF